MPKAVRAITSDDLDRLQDLSAKAEATELEALKAKGRLEFFQRLISEKYATDGLQISGVSLDTGEILESVPPKAPAQ